MKYSQYRFRPEVVPADKLEESLEILVNFFTEEWLFKNENHPLQILWKRNDVLATLELFTIGISLLSIQDQDKGWINKNINRIKKGDENNIRGYVFEIIAARMIKDNENQELILPPSDNPAIDLIARLDDGRVANVSCKNYGLSARYNLFNKNAEKLESIFINICKKYGKNKIQCIIQSLRYVEERDWSILNSNLEIMVKDFKGQDLQYILKETWYVAIVPLLEREVKFSDDYLTYTFSVMSSFHKYEKDRLYQKFEKACYDLDRFQVKQDENSINIILVHLPETASLESCQKWAQEYLDENKEKPIAGIFFIQNMIVRDIEKEDINEKGPFIATGIQTVTNDNYELWIQKSKSKELIKLKVLISGQIIDKTPNRSIMYGGKKVDNNNINLDEKYTYQKGEHYIEFNIKNGRLDRNINIEHCASGIHEYAVVIIDEEMKDLIKPCFFPDYKLILI